MFKKLFQSKILLVIIVIIICALCCFYYAGKGMAFEGLKNLVYHASNLDSDPIIIDGERYNEKNVINVLVVGLDKFSSPESSGYNRNDNCGDFIAVVSFDLDKKNYTIVQINRDTMTKVQIIGINGSVIGKQTMQIGYAHTYGNGLAQSAVNIKDAVSQLLYDVKIDYYLTMRMDAIAHMNLHMGGITVNLTNEQLSSIDEILPTEGRKSILNGNSLKIISDPVITEDWLTESQHTAYVVKDEALLFVRGRKGVEDQTNVSRMKRQNVYLEGFINRIQSDLHDIEENEKNDEKYSDIQEGTKKNKAISKAVSEKKQNYLFGMYEAIDDYIITNGNMYDIAETFLLLGNYEYNGIKIAEGTSRESGGVMEHVVNKESLESIVKEVFLKAK